MPICIIGASTQARLRNLAQQRGEDVQVLLIQFVFVMGFGMLLANLNVFARDTAQIWGLVTQGWMFLSPVFLHPKQLQEVAANGTHVADLGAGDAEGGLLQRIPAHLRDNTSGGPQWFGFSTRARLIVYNKATVQRADVDSYQKLADPKNKGKVCTRSGSHPYNLTLVGAMLQHLGAPATEAWLKGVVDNMARAPKGEEPIEVQTDEPMPTDKILDVSPMALRMSSPFNAGYWLAAA